MAHAGRARAPLSQQRLAVRGGGRHPGRDPGDLPQFADRGPFGRHGFARLSTWRFLGGDGPSTARFGLEDSAATRTAWPAAFALELSVSVGELGLVVALGVTARSDLRFTAALHTYLAVSDVHRVTVSGLQGTTFESGVEGVAGARQGEADLVVRGKLDRVYLDVERPVVLREGDGGARVVVDSLGFRDVVLWNPGPEKAGALSDMGPNEYRRMLCVEAAVIGAPVELRAGSRWEGWQRLSAEARTGAAAD